MTTAPATFTKTETLRRLRALAAEARGYERLPKRSPVEVGLRTDPITIASDPFAAESFYGPDDDLADYASFDQAASDPTVAAHGAVVHLYLSDPVRFGEWGELRNVVTAWIGTPDAAPVLLHVPGSTLR